MSLHQRRTIHTSTHEMIIYHCNNQTEYILCPECKDYNLTFEPNKGRLKCHPSYCGFKIQVSSFLKRIPSKVMTRMVIEMGI